MFDGETAVLVYGTVGEDLPVDGERWPVIGDLEYDLLLDIEHFPERSYFVKAVSDVPTFERYVLDHPAWDLVKRAAAKKGLTPETVLEWIEQYQVSTARQSTLFPGLRRLEEARRPKG